MKDLNSISWRVGFKSNNVTIFTSKFINYGDWKYKKYNFKIDQSDNGKYYISIIEIYIYIYIYN